MIIRDISSSKYKNPETSLRCAVFRCVFRDLRGRHTERGIYFKGHGLHISLSMQKTLHLIFGLGEPGPACPIRILALSVSSLESRVHLLFPCV